jgi:formate/nitrite transporter
MEVTMESKDLEALKPDALSPIATLAKAVNVGVSKAGMRPGRMFISAMLAGAFIAFGGMYFCVFLGDPSIPFAAQRVVGGICFCLGLVLVVCTGAELFTGNSLMVCSLVEKKISVGGLLKNWIIVWLGNLAGSLVAVALIYLAATPALGGGGVGEAMVSVAAGKVALPPATIFFKAIMCNVFVCLAVWVAYSSRTVVDKVAGVLLPISAFVAAGFEHCVANMFFLPTGLILNSTGVGAEGLVTLSGVLTNLGIATLGNVVGGMIVGLAFWAINRAAKSDK